MEKEKADENMDILAAKRWNYELMQKITGDIGIFDTRKPLAADHDFD